MSLKKLNNLPDKKKKKNFFEKIVTNKRYKDIFEKYVYRGEATPFTLGTLVVVAFCFLLLIISTFTQFEFSHPWLQYTQGLGFSIEQKQVAYTPLIPAMIFIIYLLGMAYSCLLFILYTIIGFFFVPIFSFGGGFGVMQNYLFGYFLGFVFAIFIEGNILRKNQSVLSRIGSAVFGVLSIHICGFIYCFILALFKVIDFGFIFIVVSALSGNNLVYDIIFSLIIILIAPYFKNIFWICMKPKTTSKEKKTVRKYLYKTSDNQ